MNNFSPGSTDSFSASLIFSNIREHTCNSRCTTCVNDPGGKLTTNVIAILTPVVNADHAHVFGELCTLIAMFEAHAYKSKKKEVTVLFGSGVKQRRQ